MNLIVEVIADYIAERYSGRVVEIGIGRYHRVAKRLVVYGFEVIATDLKEIDPPEGVKFYVDDVFEPDLRIYRGSSLIYSLRPPPELFVPIVRLAKLVGAHCLIRPFGNERPEGGRLVNYRGERFYVWV